MRAFWHFMTAWTLILQTLLTVVPPENDIYPFESFGWCEYSSIVDIVIFNDTLSYEPLLFNDVRKCNYGFNYQSI